MMFFRFKKIIYFLLKPFWKYTYTVKAKCRHDITILSSNCIGGIIYNRLGMRFNSPTINLFFTNPDFLKFISNLNHYLSQNLCFISDKNQDYPIAKCDDIYINFMHYSSEEEAESKWNERKNRIILDEAFVILYEDGLSRKELESIQNLKYKKIIVLSYCQDNIDLPYVYYIRDNKEKNGNVFLDYRLDGRMRFEQKFDFVKWLFG